MPEFAMVIALLTFVNWLLLLFYTWLVTRYTSELAAALKKSDIIFVSKLDANAEVSMWNNLPVGGGFKFDAKPRSRKR